MLIEKIKSAPIYASACCHYSIKVNLETYHATSSDELSVPLPKKLTKAAPKRQAKFIAGRYCAKQAIKQLGLEPPDSIETSADSLPLWPQGVVGSITHTHDYAAALVALTENIRSVGIDSERQLTEPRSDKIKHKILVHSEYSLMEKHAAYKAATWTTLIFSAKESIYKCLHPLTNKRFWFHDVAIIDVNPETGQFTYKLGIDLSQEFQKGYQNSGRFHINQDHLHTATALAAD